MKFLKIILIVTLLLILCVPLTYGDGTITSGETYITFKQEEPNTLNEWFYDLVVMIVKKIIEKDKK